MLLKDAEQASKTGAEGGNRTRTALAGRGILSQRLRECSSVNSTAYQHKKPQLHLWLTFYLYVSLVSPRCLIESPARDGRTSSSSPESCGPSVP